MSSPSGHYQPTVRSPFVHRHRPISSPPGHRSLAISSRPASAQCRLPTGRTPPLGWCCRSGPGGTSPCGPDPGTRTSRPAVLRRTRGTCAASPPPAGRTRSPAAAPAREQTLIRDQLRHFSEHKPRSGIRCGTCRSTNPDQGAAAGCSTCQRTNTDQGLQLRHFSEHKLIHHLAPQGSVFRNEECY